MAAKARIVSSAIGFDPISIVILSGVARAFALPAISAGAQTQSKDLSWMYQQAQPNDTHGRFVASGQRTYMANVRRTVGVKDRRDYLAPP